MFRHKRKNWENQHVFNKKCCEWTNWRPWRISHDCKFLFKPHVYSRYIARSDKLSLALGNPIGTNWGIKVLDLLGSCSVCWCNQGSHFREMALFLVFWYKTHWWLSFWLSIVKIISIYLSMASWSAIESDKVKNKPRNFLDTFWIYTLCLSSAVSKRCVNWCSLTFKSYIFLLLLYIEKNCILKGEGGG